MTLDKATIIAQRDLSRSECRVLRGRLKALVDALEGAHSFDDPLGRRYIESGPALVEALKDSRDTLELFV